MPHPGDDSLHTFEIICGRNTDEVRGRRSAVQRARAISTRTGRPVRVERADGGVQMEFRRGSLQEYMLQTRRRR